MAPTNIVTETDGEEEGLPVRRRFEFPYDIVDVDEETNRRLLKDFTGERKGFIQVGPKKYFFPYNYRRAAEHIYNFQPRSDDVWVVTYPRSGTTWTQEMVWLIANNLDFKAAAEHPLILRFPFLEYSMFICKEIKAELLSENCGNIANMNIVQNMDRPAWIDLTRQSERRFIKTHMPFSLLPPDLLTSGCKVIYIARNPKDVAVSFYHLNRLMRSQGYQNDWPTYWDYFENDLQAWAPYWEHIKEGWERRHEENMLFLFYEDINKNLRSSLQKVANFMDKSLSGSELDMLEDHLNIRNFRNNASVNFDMLSNVGMSVKGEQAFIRQGKSGGWRDYFDETLNARADRWIEANLRGTDIVFPEVKHN